MAARTKWRTRTCLHVLLVMLHISVVKGYEEYSISQLSPKSKTERLPTNIVIQTSRNEEPILRIEPSVTYEVTSDVYDDHVVVPRSADYIRESRSINIDEIQSSNNEIDNELELHNKRKYYDIHPTKTVDYYSHDDEIVHSSHGFGDRLQFRFPGEGQRVPKARALAPMGPRIRPTAVQPIFATISPRDEGRQNTEIQNIITGIVKLLNGNVNVQANSQLLNGRPNRPMPSRINNRGPPRLDLPLDYDNGMTPPPQTFYPTRSPPPYPFDRPPHHGVNLPEQIVPPLNRPGLHRPMPPWQRPRPRPPNRRPNPGLPVYKPVPLPQDLIDEVTQEVAVTENETTYSENNLHHDIALVNLPEATSAEVIENDEKLTSIAETTSTSTTTESTTISTTTQKVTTSEKSTTEEPTTTTEKPTTTTEKPTTTTEKITTTTEKLMTTTEKPTTTTTEKPTTTTQKVTTSEKPKTEKPLKPEKDKKKESTMNSEKDKKHKVEEKVPNKVSRNETAIDSIVQPSMLESKPVILSSITTPTPTEGLIAYAPSVTEANVIIETSSINSQPIPTSQSAPYQPYRPRPGIVLDDTDFKPHGSRYRPERPEASVITAPEPGIPGYGEIFDVTVSAIQGPGEKGGSVHIQHVNHLGHGDHDDIIISPSGNEGFVSIDGKKTHLNLFDTSTPAPANIIPTHVQNLPQRSTPTAAPTPHVPSLGTGEAVPADDIPQPPPRRPAHHPLHRPQQTYRRPQPTVRIDTCIVGDDSTCDKAQNEKCRTEAGISSCQCRPGFARRTHRDPCRKVVSLILNLRVDRLYDRKVAWGPKFADKESEVYQQLSYESLRAIDSAFSMTPFSDDFIGSSVNSLHSGDQNNEGVFVNYTILMQETPETLRSAVGTDIQKHILGVIGRRSNNVGASALWVDSPTGSVLPLKDVDECSTPDLNDCHQLASCTNVWGGFRCQCPDTTLDSSATSPLSGRECKACASSHCNERGVCRYSNGQPYCSCSSGYYGSTCEVDGEVVGVAVGASLAAALVIALTLAALLTWSRKWSREQKAAGMGSPVFNYMGTTIKTPPVGQPPYQVTLEERMRWAQIAEAMVQANHYATDGQTMATRPSSAMFGGYPTLPPVPLPRMGIHGNHHLGTLNTVVSRANTAASHHNLYGYTNHVATESTSSEASSHVQDRADLLVPRPKSRARSMHNQNNIYYDVDYENTAEPIYGAKGIPLSTYTVSRGPPFYRS